MLVAVAAGVALARRPLATDLRDDMDVSSRCHTRHLSTGRTIGAMRAVLLLVLTIAACKDDTSTPIDAPKPDSMGGGSACTGAAYDPCTVATDCMSMNCHF